MTSSIESTAATDAGTYDARTWRVGSATERQASELQRARSATFWKRIVSASVVVALSVMVVVSLRDRYDARDAAQKRGGAGPAAPAEDVALTHSVENSLEGSDLAEEAGAPLPSGAVALAGQEEVSVPRADVDAGHAAPPGPLAPPTVVASAPARDASADAGEITAATTTMEDATAPERPTARAARDAGAAPDPFAPPSMSAGAGPFLTEAPYHSSSAFVSNPDAGAGRFMTEAPPWSASAFVSNPEAGAGPFTTERNVPAFGVWPFAVLWPYALAPRE